MKHIEDIVTRRVALARMGGFLAFGVLARDWRFWSDEPFPHPDPRPGITAENVLPVDRLPNRKRVRAAFAAAREHPELFDGVYCVCECTDQGHRSLLSCFESEQPTGCLGCQELAELIARLSKEGKQLAQIRSAVDRKYGKGSHSHS
jgi:hypothetical protein